MTLSHGGRGGDVRPACPDVAADGVRAAARRSPGGPPARGSGTIVGAGRRTSSRWPPTRPASGTSPPGTRTTPSGCAPSGRSRSPRRGSRACGESSASSPSGDVPEGARLAPGEPAARDQPDQLEAEAGLGEHAVEHLARARRTPPTGRPARTLPGVRSSLKCSSSRRSQSSWVSTRWMIGMAPVSSCCEVPGEALPRGRQPDRERRAGVVVGVLGEPGEALRRRPRAAGRTRRARPPSPPASPGPRRCRARAAAARGRRPRRCGGRAAPRRRRSSAAAAAARRPGR